MYSHEGQLNIVKGFYHFRQFYKTYRIHERLYPASNFVIHFRIATSGLKDTDNCHPFMINDNLGFAHNGIFLNMGTRYVSDTRMFMYTILRKLPTDFLTNYEINKALNIYITVGYCKLAFLDNLNNYTIINTKAGEWNKGIWYSNTSYIESYYNGFGYSDDNFYNNDNYAELTYRNCVTCAQLLPLTQLNWSSDLGGWLCDTCNNPVPIMGSGWGYCDICKSEGEVNKAFNVQYCDTCWSSVLEFYTVICPHCTMTTTVSSKYECNTCGEIINKHDYIDLLTHC